jgi:RNA polymerase sigma-70 factor (ECF subfamily)
VTPSSASDANSADISLLTRRLAAGDESAFREFHARYFDRLYRFLLVVTRGHEDAAQEALQQTLLRVARHAREFSDEDIFWSWLKAVARNAALDGGRKRRRYLALLERFTFLRPSPEAAAGESDERWREVLDEALAEMSDEDRALIAGKYLEGARVRELAGDTGLTEKTVEARLFRLRRELADRILRKLRVR